MSNNKYIADLLPDKYYHIYNRSNNQEPLFKSEGNRLYFLQKYKSYVAPFCNTFAYCLLNNHFHLLVQIKSESDIYQAVANLPELELSKYQRAFLKEVMRNDIFQKNVISPKGIPKNDISTQAKNDISQRNVIFHQLITKQFRRFFIAYAKAFNKQHQREGNLFNRPFKRLEIEDDAHFTQLVYYIHRNPTHHHLTKDFESYKWSSYKALLSKQATTLDRETVLDWFGGLHHFKAFHQQDKPLKQIENLIIEI